jgi:hypothetical protein
VLCKRRRFQSMANVKPINSRKKNVSQNKLWLIFLGRRWRFANR